MKADDAIAPSPEVPTDTMAVIKEPAPAFTRAVWDTSNKICLLGRFKATFIITYAGQNGDEVRVNFNPVSNGCGELITRLSNPDHIGNITRRGYDERKMLFPTSRPSFGIIMAGI